MNTPQRSYYVTGGSGFVGRRLCERLAGRGKVRILCRRSCEGPWDGADTPVSDAYVTTYWGENEWNDTVFSAYIDLWIDGPGEYRVIVWGDFDGDRQADWDEPQVDAVWWHPDAGMPDGGFDDVVFSLYDNHPDFGPEQDGTAVMSIGDK